MFSVIIPVHNSEKTIRRCLDSIANQTHKDFEALVIENGSTDASIAICREYAAKDNRFKVFDIGKCNGPSRPRNYALNIAKGDYIAFVDSDDWVEPEYLNTLAEVLTDSDIVFLGAVVEDANGNCIKKNIPKLNIGNKTEQIYGLVKSDCFGYSWCKAFSRKKYVGIRFDESIDILEDLLFTMSLLKKKSRIGITSRLIYHYVNCNPQALTQIVRTDMIQKKDFQFKIHYSLLKEKYFEYLVELANDYVSFCVNYAFENNFNVRSSFKDIKNAFFFITAKENPNKWVRILDSGYCSFLLSNLKHRIKLKCYRLKADLEKAYKEYK